MICPRCQAQLPEGSVACNKCGLSFQYQQPVLLYKPPAKPKNTKKTVIIVLSSIFGSILLICIIALIYVYRPQKIDYGDEKAFEQALNAGKNVDGKIVKFKIREYATPPAGYNLHAGKHLNFISFTNPGVSTGDTITVKVKRVQHTTEEHKDIWSIWYSIVRNGKETDETIYSD